MQAQTIVFSDIDFSYKEGLLLIKGNDKYGYINTVGKVIVPFIYDKALPFNEGLAAVCLNGKFGYIDKNNNVVIPFKYQNAGDFSEGLAPVMLDGTWRYIDRKDKQHIELDSAIHVANPFSGGLAPVYNNQNKGGYINLSGDLIIPDIYEYADHFNEGLALVESGLYIGYINPKGAYVIPCIHYNGLNCCKGLVSVHKGDDTWTVFDKEGNEVDNFSDYEFVDIFKNDYAMVKQNGKYGIADIDGKKIIPCIYDHPIIHQDNLFCACLDGRWGALDKQHNMIIPFKYSKLLPLSENRYFAKNKKKKNLIIDSNDSVICTLSSCESRNHKRDRTISLIDKSSKILATLLGLLALGYLIYELISSI